MFSFLEAAVRFIFEVVIFVLEVVVIVLNPFNSVSEGGDRSLSD